MAIGIFESLGIHLNPADQRPFHNKQTYESDVPGIYLAGVVVARIHTNEVFIEVRLHGEVIIRDIRQRL